MKAFWQAQVRRIDALSLRERVIMFASGAIALAAAADALVLSPALAERRQLAEQLRQESRQIDALRSQLAARLSGATDDSPQGRALAAIERARAEQRALDDQVRAQFAGREEMARLPAVLDRLLSRHERLKLVKLETATPPPKPPSADPAAPGVRWQGVDLSVSGNYADLVQYLGELEQALPGLRWGPLSITTPTQPPVLSVRLMLPGEAP
jgi:MSHA biogenesis protein MshJ